MFLTAQGTVPIEFPIVEGGPDTSLVNTRLDPMVKSVVGFGFAVSLGADRLDTSSLGAVHGANEYAALFELNDDFALTEKRFCTLANAILFEVKREGHFYRMSCRQNEEVVCRVDREFTVDWIRDPSKSGPWWGRLSFACLFSLQPKPGALATAFTPITGSVPINTGPSSAAIPQFTRPPSSPQVQPGMVIWLPEAVGIEEDNCDPCIIIPRGSEDD